MKELHSERTLTPTKAGRLFGKFTPSPTRKVIVGTVDGKPKIISLNRKERRSGSYKVIRKLS